MRGDRRSGVEGSVNGEFQLLIYFNKTRRAILVDPDASKSIAAIDRSHQQAKAEQSEEGGGGTDSDKAA